MVITAEVSALKGTPAVQTAAFQFAGNTFALEFQLIHGESLPLAAEIVNKKSLNDLLIRETVFQPEDLGGEQGLPEIIGGNPVPDGDPVNILFLRDQIGDRVLTGVILHHKEFQCRITAF